jgi:hypothetical protein
MFIVSSDGLITTYKAHHRFFGHDITQKEDDSEESHIKPDIIEHK